MTANDETFDIPKECWAGVVVNEGPDFRVELQKLPVPEIGTAPAHCFVVKRPYYHALRREFTCSRYPLRGAHAFSSHLNPCWYANNALSIGVTDVLIKLNATGICHSDLHYMMNDWGLGPMSAQGTKCAGHEGAGVIVKVGELVKNLKVGMRAGYKPIADTCGICDLCRTDGECYCAKGVLTGFHCDGIATPGLIARSLTSSACFVVAIADHLMQVVTSSMSPARKDTPPSSQMGYLTT